MRIAIVFLGWIFLLATLAACEDGSEAGHEAVVAQAAPESDPSDPASLASALTVYKSPTCGCCGAWVEHVSDRGFSARVIESADLDALKVRFGIAPDKQSCHTAVTAQGFVIEGHVPAPVITRFLQNPPAGAIGLTVPGMPLGSPGMEMGDNFMPYDVLLLMDDGSTAVYQRIEAPEQQY